MRDLTPAVNLKFEVAALAKFISIKWTPIQNIEALFEEIKEAAMHAARGWLNQYVVSDCVATLSQDRATQLALNTGSSSAQHYDAVCSTLMSMACNVSCVSTAGLNLDGQWDYSRRVAQLYYHLQSRYPDLAAARPHGWDALAKGYCDFDGQEDYSGREDLALFEGSVHTTGRSPSVVASVALPYVMYDEMCQGRKAAEVLVGAVYSHFLGIAEFLNGASVCADIKAFVGRQSSEMVFELSGSSENPFTKALLSLSNGLYSKQDFEKNEEDIRLYATLSDEEKAERKRKADAVAHRIISEIIAKESDGTYEEKTRQQQEQLKKLLQGLLG